MVLANRVCVFASTTSTSRRVDGLGLCLCSPWPGRVVPTAGDGRRDARHGRGRRRGGRFSPAPRVGIREGAEFRCATTERDTPMRGGMVGVMIVVMCVIRWA